MEELANWDDIDGLIDAIDSNDQTASSRKGATSSSGPTSSAPSSTAPASTMDLLQSIYQDDPSVATSSHAFMGFGGALATSSSSASHDFVVGADSILDAALAEASVAGAVALPEDLLPEDTTITDLIGTSLREPRQVGRNKKRPGASGGSGSIADGSSDAGGSSVGTKRVLRENENGEVDIVEVSEVTEDNSVHITSATYHRKRRLPKRWSEEETRSFLQLLQQYGSNFAMLENFFPARSRDELKAKYRHEEMTNPERLDKYLRSHRPIDLEKFKEQKEKFDTERAAQLQLQQPSNSASSSSTALQLPSAGAMGLAPSGNAIFSSLEEGFNFDETDLLAELGLHPGIEEPLFLPAISTTSAATSGPSSALAPPSSLTRVKTNPDSKQSNTKTVRFADDAGGGLGLGFDAAANFDLAALLDDGDDDPEGLDLNEEDVTGALDNDETEFYD